MCQSSVSPLKKTEIWAGNMPQWVRGLAAKYEDLRPNS